MHDSGAPKFYPSAYNSASDVRNLEHIRIPLNIVDITLREGQQAPGVNFSLEGELEVTKALCRAGVKIVQAGYAVRDEATIARIREAIPDVTMAVLAVGWSPELTTPALKRSVDAGASICSILMRSSPRHLNNLGLNEREAVRHVGEATARALDAGFTEVIVAPSFTTLADFKLLELFYEAGIAEGASVVSIADSTGIAKPAAIRSMVTRLREKVGDAIGIKIHTHNDYGLALANTLAGVEAGANWIDASVLGLGERAGNCALEELVVALKGLYGLDVEIDPAALVELCGVVAKESGFTLSPMKPVVGANVFANMLELHVKAIATDPTLLEPYDPAAVGNRRTVRIGRGSGPTGVRMKAAELGMDLSPRTVDQLVESVNLAATTKGHEIGDEEFVEIVLRLQDEVRL